MIKLIAAAQAKWTSFKSATDGATMIEYGLIAGLIAVVLIGVLSTMSSSLSGLFTTISDELDGATGG